MGLKQCCKHIQELNDKLATIIQIILTDIFVETDIIERDKFSELDFHHIRRTVTPRYIQNRVYLLPLIKK